MAFGAFAAPVMTLDLNLFVPLWAAWIRFVTTRTVAEMQDRHLHIGIVSMGLSGAVAAFARERFMFVRSQLLDLV